MHARGRIVTAMMSEVTSQLQAKFCKHAKPAKEKKLLSVIALSVKQEINKSETLSHGISEVAKVLFIKTGIHHMASLDLLILHKPEIQQNWNLYHMASLGLLFCRNRNSTKLELYNTVSVELPFLWTSIMIKTV